LNQYLVNAWRLASKPLDESLPNQQVEVTTPVRGTVTRLLVQPGDQVSAGQAVAIDQPELAELRTTVRPSSGSNRLYQQAQTDLRLAQQNFAQQQKIAATDVAQARTQMSFAQGSSTKTGNWQWRNSPTNISRIGNQTG